MTSDELSLVNNENDEITTSRELSDSDLSSRGIAGARLNSDTVLSDGYGHAEFELLKRVRIERRKRWEESELEKLKAKGLTGDKLDAAFNKRRKQYKEPAPVDTSDLPELPKGWCWTNLNELKEYSIYGPRFSNDLYAKSGTFVLRTTDIDESGRVNTQTAPKIKLSKKEVEKYMVHIGDLLITRTGSIGTLAVYNDEVEAIPGAYLLQYRLAWNNELSRIIFHQLKSPRCQDKMTGGSAGTGRANLNAPTLESISLVLPQASASGCGFECPCGRDGSRGVTSSDLPLSPRPSTTLASATLPETASQSKNKKYPTTATVAATQTA